MSQLRIPLVIDLDGTLIRTDLLLESLYAAIHHKPTLIVRLPFWILHGKVNLNEQLSKHVNMDLQTCPPIGKNNGKYEQFK